MVGRFLQGEEDQACDQSYCSSVGPVLGAERALRAPVRAHGAGFSLKWLSVKTALLLALTSAKRVSDLCALSIQSGCLTITGDRARAVLRPNPAFVPEVIGSSYSSQVFELRAFLLRS